MADPDDTTTLGRAPAFQFYPSDFISGTIDLSAEEVGAYIRLLCYQWAKGHLPPDEPTLARIAGLHKARMAHVWGRISRHFTPTPVGFLNARLERVREEQIAFRRRQAENGKRGGRPKPRNNPGLSSGLSQTQPTPNPKQSSSSSVFSLQSSTKRIASAVEEEIALDFAEQYPALYARVRSGARYAVSRVAMDRDLDYARDLAHGWPDLKRLLEMAEVFLRMEIGDKNRPGTLGQFLHMAPDADTQLRKNGR